MKILIDDLIPDSPWVLYFPHKSTFDTIRKYERLIDVNDEKNARWIRKAFSLRYRIDIDWFSDVFYKNPLQTEVFNAKNLVLDERFEHFYQAMKHLFQLNGIDAVECHYNLLLRYEQNKNLNFFYKYMDKFDNYFYSTKVREIEDKYTLYFDGCELKNNKNNDKSISFWLEKVFPVYEKIMEVYDDSDAFEDIYIHNNSEDISDIFFHFTRQNFLSWQNNEITKSLKEECVINAEKLCQILCHDLKNIYQSKCLTHQSIYSEYFSYLQNFVNKQLLCCDEKTNLYIAQQFIKTVKCIEFPVVLEGKLKDIYVNYYHLFDLKINTLENIDEIKNFYEKIYKSPLSLESAPTSVLRYFSKTKGLVYSDSFGIEQDKYMPEVEDVNNVVDLSENDNITIYDYLRQKTDVKFILHTNTIKQIIKLRWIVDDIVISDNFELELDRALKTGEIDKSDYEYWLSIRSKQNNNKIMKVI